MKTTFPFKSAPRIFRRLAIGCARALGSLSASAALLGLLAIPSRAATFDTYADAISGTPFFPLRMLWVGELPPDESESQSLWQILENWRASGHRAGLADLEMFLAAYTNSPWAPSLHANLALHYGSRGQTSVAL